MADVGDECAWFGVIEFIGEGVVAAFADAHVAEVVVVDSVVADGGADSADVADEVEVGDVLVVVGVSEGAALFGAGGEAAVDAVEAGADAADWAAEQFLVADCALGLQHFFVGTDEKLELVALGAFVI